MSAIPAGKEGVGEGPAGRGHNGVAVRIQRLQILVLGSFGDTGEGRSLMVGTDTQSVLGI